MDRPKFAVVREDPAIEEMVCARVGARSILTVASGGCTALSLVHAHPELAVTAFDMNPVQLAHVRAKAEAIANGDLGELRMLNQCGEFEGLFRTLRRFVEEFVAPREELLRFFAGSVERREAWFANKYWKVGFELALHDSFLHAMFGPAATQHAEPGSYPGYFQRVFERGLRRPDATTNPFLEHVLLGDYEHPPKFLQARRALPIELVQGTLLDAGDLRRFDVISLSNIFDWSDDALVAEWARALDASRSGTAIIVRQLNNRRDVRRFFPQFTFDDALGEELVSRDRSLFYERIEVGFRA
jgi:S-adenosylmethionine-diacylglycerol 3-amino-3-carboxypropyl transferase